MVRFFNEFWSRDETGQVLINWELCYDLTMQMLHKLLLNLALAVSALVVLYALFTGDANIKPVAEITSGIRNASSNREGLQNIVVNTTHHVKHKTDVYVNYLHIWCILTKVETHPSLKKKFENFAESLVMLSSRSLNLHIISDDGGRLAAEETFDKVEDLYGKYVKINYYQLSELAERLEPLVAAMQPYFSSTPGSYYSDALFFLSIGLHRVAPLWMSHCIMVDIDTQFKTDPALLWAQFDHFSSTELIGLSPELSPVYRHALHAYINSKQGNTKVGKPFSEGGYPGLNSGVILLNLDRLRTSKIFSDLCEKNTVKALAKKYSFKGHLGDQDFYSLVGIERPELISLLPCTWNRQLCTWWRDHGYADIFHRYFECKGKINLYHGNCNTPFPSG